MAFSWNFSRHFVDGLAVPANPRKGRLFINLFVMKMKADSPGQAI
jgi:hypothetical protein